MAATPRPNRSLVAHCGLALVCLFPLGAEIPSETRSRSPAALAQVTHTPITHAQDTLPRPTWGVPPDAIKVTERFFNENGEDGWGLNRGGSNRYVADPSAPVDAPTVLEMPFGPCRNCGASGMGNRVVKNWVRRGLPAGRELWIEGWFKWSANWINNPAIEQKLMYPTVRNTANHPFYIGERGFNRSPHAPLYLVLGLGGQDNRVCGHNRSLRIHGRRPGATLPRGEWVNLRFYFKTNDHGSCNAIARAWVNGVEVIDTTGFVFVDPGVANVWWALNYDPVWGGGRGDLPAEQTIRTAWLRAYVR